MLGSAPPIVTATVTPVLMSEPPLPGAPGAHQPYAPRGTVELETSEHITGIDETYGATDHRCVPRARQWFVGEQAGPRSCGARTRLVALTDPAVVAPNRQRPTHEGER
ncbi:hypothetical protein P8605_01795 [Streptomyces sp. T-3]|nr:hypothetical protein [Streptomyces sp. T-3]